jgi:hypothetical protein
LKKKLEKNLPKIPPSLLKDSKREEEPRAIKRKESERGKRILLYWLNKREIPIKNNKVGKKKVVE